MKTLRRLSTFLLSGAIALVFVPAAQAAVTNPADSPYRIVVKGDDGNTYVDGQDTLPGYDDEECTYIPGAWFDFANNRVHYADGQSIPWTEWERASGYKDWLAQQAKSARAGVATTASAAPAASKGAGSGSIGKATTSTTGSAVAKAAAPSAAVSSPTTGQAAPATHAEAPGAAPVTALSPAAAVTTADVTRHGSDDNPGRATGIAILGSLLALGALTYIASGVRRRIVGREWA